MAQVGVDVGSYLFDASAQTITFIGVTVTDIEQIKPIVNGKQGVVIFNPAETGLFGDLVANVLTLDYDTTSHNDTDELYICINDPETDNIVKVEDIDELTLSSKLLQVDEDSVANTTYIGYADAGSPTSLGVWAIKRIIQTGCNISVTWADGNKNFDNEWDDRLILIYS